MKPKFLHHGADRRDRWMVSYVDVLTIVLVFFLVAAAKLPKVVPAPPLVDKSRAELLRAEAGLRDRGLKPTLEARGLVISLPQAILFGAGEDKVNLRAYSTVAAIAEVLRAIPNEVRLIGYADTVPIHTRRFHSNWDLSMARSQRILELLSSRYGIAESRLSIASYGPYRPAAPNDTADGRASNRRVEIVILDDKH